ncbi:heat shock transcription factor, Y-linked-like [Polistes fuscatus]|uniref:heat shock transcription factor, Y-linked-like n=1 Tax=Polistes fuscatus TaxID=30207 RepID=UPI001CA8EC56|nr:heat shock transcription factor, Y-linked-like [Polistes fuscatus]
MPRTILRIVFVRRKSVPIHISGLPSSIMYDDRILSMRFPQKLWKIVNACKSGAIQWNTDGTSILLDYKQFQEEYLDGETSIFKTRNITSFIRQLNLYGFRKVTSHNRDPLCSCYNPNVHEFMHENFQAGRVELLSRVCRKSIGKNKYFQNFGPLRCKDLTTPVSHLRMCQLALTRTLEQLSRERREKSLNESTRNESFSSVSSEQELPEYSPFFAEKPFSIPQSDRSQEYLIKNGMDFYSKRNCSSINNNVPQPWFIPNTQNFAFYMPLNNTK